VQGVFGCTDNKVAVTNVSYVKVSSQERATQKWS
jgi:hypothetical protein